MSGPEDAAEPERPLLPVEEPAALAQTPAVPLEAATAENAPASEAPSAPVAEAPPVAEPAPAEEAFPTVPTYLVDSAPELAARSDSALDVSGQSAEDALRALRDLVKSSRDGTSTAETGQPAVTGSSSADTPATLHEATGEEIDTDAVLGSEWASGSLLVAGVDESVGSDSEGFDLLDAALHSAVQPDAQTAANAAGPDDPDIFEPLLSSELEDTPDPSDQAGVEQSISALSRLTDGEATVPAPEELDAELLTRDAGEDSEPAHAAFEEAVLNLSSGEPLSTSGAAEEIGGEIEGVARSTENAQPKAEASADEAEPDAKVLAFPAPDESAAADPTDVPNEITSTAADRPPLFDLEPQLDLLAIGPQAVDGPSQKLVEVSELSEVAPAGGVASALVPPTQALAPGAKRLPIEAARRPSENDWALEAIREHLAVDQILEDRAARGVSAAGTPDPGPPLIQDQERLAPSSSEPALPQSLLAGHATGVPGPGELTVTELIEGEPAVRGSEAVLEEMEIQVLQLSVG